MKRTNAILISVIALASLAAVVAVQAQDTGTKDNANYGPVPASEVSANANTNAELPPPAPPTDANANTNAVRPLPPPSTTAAPTSSTALKLIKIPSPDYIKYFREVRKIGDALYGFLISGANTVMGKNAQSPAGTAPVVGTSPTATNPTSGTSPTAVPGANLIKIPSPDYIKYFREIRKIGDSLYGILVNGMNVAKPRHVVTADESACVISAITTKDQAIMAAQTAEATGFNSAVAARTACQTTALGSADGQGAALEKCIKDFRIAVAAVRETLNKAQKDAWTAYTGALKSCATTPTATNTNTTASSEIMVEDGGSSL
jgi:hypothetical protein